MISHFHLDKNENKYRTEPKLKRTPLSGIEVTLVLDKHKEQEGKKEKCISDLRWIRHLLLVDPKT